MSYRGKAVFPILVTNIVSLDKIYFIRITHLKMLEKIHQHVQIATRCENLDACLSLKDGDLIFARLPGELLWYRGQILSREESGTLSVLLIDYGDIFSIKNTVECVREMPSFFKQFQPLINRMTALNGEYLPYEVESLKECLSNPSVTYLATDSELIVANDEDQEYMSLSECLRSITGKTNDASISEKSFDCQPETEVVVLLIDSDKLTNSFQAKLLGSRMEYDQMNKSLRTFYEKAPFLNAVPLVEGMYVVVLNFSIPGSKHFFHRGRVTCPIDSNQKAKIFLLDFGITVHVHWSSLMNLKSDFLELPSLVIKCTVSSQDDVVHLQDFQTLHLKILNKVSESHFLVQLRTEAALAAQPTNEQSEDSLSVQDSPFEESFENKIDPETEIRNTEKFEDLNEQQLKEEDEYVPVKVINCVSPSEIYVRPMKQINDFNFALSEMKRKMWQIVEFGKPLKDPQSGEFVIAKIKSSVYRAIVEATDPSTKTCTLKMIDFGNRVKQTTESDNLFPLPQELSSSSTSHLMCLELAGLAPDNGNEWSENAIEAVQSICNSGKLCVRSRDIEKSTETVIKVEIFDQQDICEGPFSPFKKTYESLSSKFFRLNLGCPNLSESGSLQLSEKVDPHFETTFWKLPLLPSTSDFIARISHVDEVGQFYVQPKPEIVDKATKLINQYFGQDLCCRGLPSPSHGQAIMCRVSNQSFPEWQRSVITNILPGNEPSAPEVAVYLVDQGSSWMVQWTENNCSLDLVLQDLSIQCLRVMPAHVRPVEKIISDDSIDALRSDLIGRMVRVYLEQGIEQFPPEATLYLEDSLEGEANVSKRLLIAKAFDFISADWNFQEDFCLRESYGGHIQNDPQRPPDSETDLETAIVHMKSLYSYPDLLEMSGLRCQLPVNFKRLDSQFKAHFSLCSTEESLKKSLTQVQTSKFQSSILYRSDQILTSLDEVCEEPPRLPFCGPNVACLVRSEYKWRRGEILALLANQEALVHLVDDLEISTFQLTDLRKPSTTVLSVPKFNFIVCLESISEEVTSVLKMLDEKEQLFVGLGENGSSEVLVRDLSSGETTSLTNFSFGCMI